MDQAWPWILTAVGLTGFVLAGRKVWWCWYVNLFCQLLWFIYAFTTEQYGFVLAAMVYTVVFMQNAAKWTYAHRRETRERKSSTAPKEGS